MSTRLRRTAALLTLALLALAVPALAATKNGITPISPKRGATISHEVSQTFRFRSKGAGSTAKSVFLRVCRSRKVNKRGLICDTGLTNASRKGRTFSARLPAYSLDRPGTYYWQAYRIAFSGDDDVVHEGPIVRIKVG